MIIDYHVLFPEAGHPSQETFQRSFIIIQSVLVDNECLFVQGGLHWPGNLPPVANGPYLLLKVAHSFLKSFLASASYHCYRPPGNRYVKIFTSQGNMR